MLFSYKALDKVGTPREGTVDARNIESAIETVEGRGYAIISVDPVEEEGSFADIKITWFERVTYKEIVILSRQIATLFEAQVSPLRIFRLLASENANPKMQRVLTEISDDLQAGSPMSKAMSRHSDVFSPFYVSMVKSGEESGKLEQVFIYMAEYIDRTYQIIAKTRGALIYPAFVISIFFAVMGLMLTLVIPSITQILIDSGQELPIYTKIVIALSDLLVNYFVYILILFMGAGFFYWQFQKTEAGKRTIDEFKLSVPVFQKVYQNLLLTRICDNLSTMLTSGISMVQALEVTAEIVNNRVYKEIIEQTLIDVKGGKSFADALSEYPEIPGVLAQMAKVGEETGKLGEILRTLSTFYHREVNDSIDKLIGLIEPAMIVLLGLGVGVLLASVLMPIYNITGNI